MKITNYVEEHIFSEKIFSKIFGSQQIQIDKLNNNLNDLIDQAYICTATWGLKNWEEELEIQTDENDTINNRRSRCFAKIRGNGNCTIDYIKNVALSYEYGDINVIEDYENYKFIIEFISNKGQPPRVDDFKKTLRSITPAHLGIDFKFKYVTWGEVKNKSWQDLKTLTWDEVLNGKAK